MILKRMTDFVFELNKNENVLDYVKDKESLLKYWKLTFNYMKFLRKPFKLEMIIPCDSDGKILRQPTCTCQTEFDREGCGDRCYEYVNACNKILFEGYWDYSSDDKYKLSWVMNYSTNTRITLHDCKTIEDLAKYNLTIKKSVQEKYGINRQM